jgi:pimeloyl-ACP methyl ester carboxylesterase
MPLMAGDVRALLDHLAIARADIMGYSMGARITAFLAVHEPSRVRSAILGGLGIRLIEGHGSTMANVIADALLAPSLDDVTDPTGRMFRMFAEQTKSDLKALSACMRRPRQILNREQVAGIKMPVLVAVGSNDDVAGSGAALAALIPGAQALDIPGRDHMLAVGDKVFKSGVLEFLNGRP